MGILYCVSTPIGNLDDITIRAVKTLFTADIIACEDTRRTGQLMAGLHARFDGALDIPEPAEDIYVRYDATVEYTVLPELIDQLQRGKSVALVTDAGTPGIADPGFLLVREARKRAIPVVSIPGASAVLTALVASGLPTTTWTFLGFPPEKTSHERQFFERVQRLGQITPTTFIVYASPHKLAQTLDLMREQLGDIELVVARELTKVHEEFWRGTVSEAEVHYRVPKGEFVLLFSLP